MHITTETKQNNDNDASIFWSLTKNKNILNYLFYYYGKQLPILYIHIRLNSYDVKCWLIFVFYALIARVNVFFLTRTFAECFHY